VNKQSKTLKPVKKAVKKTAKLSGLKWPELQPITDESLQYAASPDAMIAAQWKNDTQATYNVAWDDIKYLWKPINIYKPASTPVTQPCQDSASMPVMRHDIYAAVLPYVWHAQAEAEGQRPLATETALFRHSGAGFCARRLYYDAMQRKLGEPERYGSEGMDVVGHWVTGLGTLVHDHWQHIVQQINPKLEIEVKVEIPEVRSAGHADLYDPDKLVLGELKTTNGTGFKTVVADHQPKFGAIVQAALNARALDAVGRAVDKIVVSYLAMEAMSPRYANQYGITEPHERVSADFVYEREQWEPFADAEVARMSTLLENVELEMAPARTIPSYDGTIEVVNPSTGKTTSGKTTWHCQYCPFQDACVADVD